MILPWVGATAAQAQTSPPTITSISPTSGPVAGGTVVTITGTNLTGATGVSFGGIPASFTVESDAEITATTPAASEPGSVPVAVVTPGGEFSTGGFIYELTTPTVTLTSSTAAPAYGEDVTLTAIIAGGSNPTGTVTFMDNGTELGTTTVSGNTATFTTSSLTVGSNSISATYNGDAANYAAVSNPLVLTVGPAMPTISLAASSTSTMQGMSETLTATVSGGTPPLAGSVTFKDGGTVLATLALSGTSVSYATTSLAIGSHTITAVYSGNANNAAATSSALAVTIGSRPDPADDPTVSALIESQVASATIFAQTQIDNTIQRLEQLQDEADEGAVEPTQAADPVPPIPGAAGADPSEQPAGEEASSNATGGQPSSNGATNANGGQDVNTLIEAITSLQRQAALPFHLWAGGDVQFGHYNADGSYSHQLTTSGFTVGVDRKLSERVTAGFAVGYGSNSSDLDNNGSWSDGLSYSGTLYADVGLGKMTYLNLLGGFGTLRFNDQRWSTDGDAWLDGSRDGHEWFGSAGLSTAAIVKGVLISPYARLDVIRVDLDSFTETGSSYWALTYGSLGATTEMTVFGVRANYPIEMPWGTLTPGLRLEYQHELDGSFYQTLGYADLGGAGYGIYGTATTTSTETVGVSLAAMFHGNQALDLEYLTSANNGTTPDQEIRANLEVPF